MCEIIKIHSKDDLETLDDKGIKEIKLFIECIKDQVMNCCENDKIYFYNDEKFDEKDAKLPGILIEFIEKEFGIKICDIGTIESTVLLDDLEIILLELKQKNLRDDFIDIPELISTQREETKLKQESFGKRQKYRGKNISKKIFGKNILGYTRRKSFKR